MSADLKWVTQIISCMESFIERKVAVFRQILNQEIQGFKAVDPTLKRILFI